MAEAEQGLVELEEYFRREIAGKDLLLRLTEEGTTMEFTSSSATWALINFMGNESLQDPIGLFWKMYKSGNGFHWQDTFTEDSEEWDEVVLVTLKRLYDRHKVPYDPDGDSRPETRSFDLSNSPPPAIPQRTTDRGR